MEFAMRNRSVVASAATIALVTTVLVPVWAQQGSAPTPAARNFDPSTLPDQEIGRRVTVKPDDLPEPKTGPVVASRPLTVPYAGQAPRVPEGFAATAFATDLEHPRRLLVLPNGDVLVAEQKVGYVTLLRDADGDGKAEWRQRHVEGLNQPYGLAWRDGNLLVADQDGIWQVPHELGNLRPGRREQQTAAEVPPEQRKPSPAVVGEKMITRKGVFGIAKGHSNRHLAIDPKSGALFVGVGSSGNIGVEPEPKATIQRFDADGGNQTTFASGMRNPTSHAFHPTTGDLWALVQERDGMGDRLVPDFLVNVKQGAFYGWPYAYIGPNKQPGFAHLAPDKVQATVVPDLLFEAHSSAMDIVFYEGQQFPAEYRGNAIVALKGSWNRSEPTGYKVVRVPFKDGQPEGFYENFVAGFWIAGESRAEVWGRPAALAVANDGSLLIADDTGGTIWRVAYVGSQQQADRPPAATTGAPPR
jgi:glucose/arabinose dehydrogenase